MSPSIVLREFISLSLIPPRVLHPYPKTSGNAISGHDQDGCHWSKSLKAEVRELKAVIDIAAVMLLSSQTTKFSTPEQDTSRVQLSTVVTSEEFHI